MTEIADRRGKRAAILRGGQAVFVERGFAGATMDAVAQAAQVSKRTLYHHFASKEALFQAIVAEFLSAQDRGEAPVYRPGADLRDDLRRFARLEMYLIDADERRGLSRLLTGTFLHDPGFGVRTHGQHDPQAAFIAWVEAAVTDGTVKVSDAGLAARVFYGLVQGAVTWPALITDGASLRGSGELLDEIVEVWLARYGALGEGRRQPS